MVFRKYYKKTRLLNLELRVLMYNKGINGVIKCCSRFNHYVLRDHKINREVVIKECPMCPEMEIWDHPILCIQTEELKKEYLANMKDTLLKVEKYNTNLKRY